MWNLTYLIIDFQAGEGGIFKANIDANHVINKSVGLVSFKWWRDGQSSLGVTIQNVHQLLLLNST